MKPMEKNIIVTDNKGKRLGLTYSKRAKGLVKSGRAEFISENEIRLSDQSSYNIVSVPVITEVNKMSEFDKKSSIPEEENKIFFNAREWSVCNDAAASKCERTFVTDFEKNLSEAYCIGDKTQNTSVIGTKQLILSKNTKYTFYFWVKLERNIKYDAICQLQIIYNNDFDNKRVYVLSNSNIRPAKITDGWQLYEIPFVTEDNEYTQLRFSVKSAICTIIPGKDARSYASLPDDDDYDQADAENPDDDSTSDSSNAFKNISNTFKDFFGQFDPNNKQSADKNPDKDKSTETKSDPFAAFNSFAEKLKKDVQREVNKNIRNDIYTDIKAMKDDIVNEIKNTFNNGNKQ